MQGPSTLDPSHSFALAGPMPTGSSRRWTSPLGPAMEAGLAAPAPVFAMMSRRLGRLRPSRDGAGRRRPVERRRLAMSRVVLDVSISLDGFAAGPNVGQREPMGEGGERLHEWMAGDGPDGGVDIGVHREVDAMVGATIIGRRTFDLGLGPWGGTPWPGVPSFVVTHRTREDLLGDNGGTFAFDGLEAAARRAKDSAGDKDVLVLGADVAGQLLEAG